MFDLSFKQAYFLLHLFKLFYFYYILMFTFILVHIFLHRFCPSMGQLCLLGNQEGLACNIHHIFGICGRQETNTSVQTPGWHYSWADQLNKTWKQQVTYFVLPFSLKEVNKAVSESDCCSYIWWYTWPHGANWFAIWWFHIHTCFIKNPVFRTLCKITLSYWEIHFHIRITVYISTARHLFTVRSTAVSNNNWQKYW